MVPDFTDRQAWVKNLEGVGYVLHLATPKTRDHFDEDQQFVQTAVDMSTSLLQAVAEVKTVKRVVVTSSCVAVTSRRGSTNDVISGDNRVARLPTPYPNAAVKYVASKIETLKSVDAFIENQKPTSLVVNILLGWSIGRNELASSPQSLLETSNFMVLLSLLGKPLPFTGRLAFPTVHVEDLADLHVRALGPEITDHCSIVAAGLTHYGQIMPIARKGFPEAIELGKLPGIEVLFTRTYTVDNRSVEDIFKGFRFRSFEDQVISVSFQRS